VIESHELSNPLGLLRLFLEGICQGAHLKVEGIGRLETAAIASVHAEHLSLLSLNFALYTFNGHRFSFSSGVRRFLSNRFNLSPRRGERRGDERARQFKMKVGTRAEYRKDKRGQSKTRQASA
jgi:hypothetical protein